MTYTRTEKTFERGFAKGWRMIEDRDGVQRTQWFFAPDNFTENANFTLWTSRHSDGVTGKANGDQTPLYRAAGMWASKDQCFNDLRRQFIGRFKEGK